MKKIYPVGNKIFELLESENDYYNDVPTSDPDEYKTQIPLDNLPKGGYGYEKEDTSDPINISPPIKKKRKFIEEPPPKENFENDLDVDFEDNDSEDDITEQADDDENNSEDQDTQNEDPSNQATTTQQVDPSTGQPIDTNTVQQPQDGSMVVDPNAAGGMAGYPNMGMPGEEPPKTAEEIGRIFELKKIYSRLLAVEEHLSFSSDELLLKLRDFVSQTIELFETLISNVDSFKDEIDDIIVMFYKFLEYVYSIMKRYYKIKEKEDQKQVDKSKLFTKFPEEKNKNNPNKTSSTNMLTLNNSGM